jgi:hypothetical protein
MLFTAAGTRQLGNAGKRGRSEELEGSLVSGQWRARSSSQRSGMELIKAGHRSDVVVWARRQRMRSQGPVTSGAPIPGHHPDSDRATGKSGGSWEGWRGLLGVVAGPRNQLDLQCPLDRRFPCVLSTLCQGENACELALELEAVLTVLLRKNAPPRRSSCATTRMPRGVGRGREMSRAVDTGAVDRRQLWMQEWLLFGVARQHTGQPRLLRLQLLELGIECLGVAALENDVHELLDLAARQVPARAAWRPLLDEASDRCLGPVSLRRAPCSKGSMDGLSRM